MLDRSSFPCEDFYMPEFQAAVARVINPEPLIVRGFRLCGFAVFPARGGCQPPRAIAPIMTQLFHGRYLSKLNSATVDQ
jgi:hypothetical protein